MTARRALNWAVAAILALLSIHGDKDFATACLILLCGFNVFAGLRT